METYRFRIGGHLCEIAFCNEGDGVDLISSFAPFAVEDGGNFLFRLVVDKDFRWETVTALIRVGIGKELPSHDSDWENVLRITR